MKLVIFIFFVILLQFIISFLTKFYILARYNEKCNPNCLETGDILLYSYEPALSGSQNIKLFTMSVWSHVGIVCKINGEIKVLECVGSLTNPGVQINDLEKTMGYPGCVNVMKINKKVTPMQLPEKYKKFGFRTQLELTKIFLLRTFGIKTCKLKGGDSHCAEFIGKVMKHWKIIPSTINEVYLFPNDFLNIPTINGYSYSPPKLLKL